MSDFVVVTAPQVQLCDVLAVCNDTRRGPSDDAAEFSTLIDRCAFFSDVVRSFSVTARAPPEQSQEDAQFILVSASDDACISSKRPVVTFSDDHWTKISRQFALDIHRENFVINGVRYTDAQTAIAKVRECVVAVKEQLTHGAQAACWVGSWFGLPVETTSCNDRNSLRHVEQLTQEIILMSQQSVLAFPLEAIQKHVAALATRKMETEYEFPEELFVGEAREADFLLDADLRSSSVTPSASNRQQFMRVELESKGSSLHLRISKWFRVFSIDDDSGMDQTRRLVDAVITISLFGGVDDPVHLSWTVRRDLAEPKSNVVHPKTTQHNVDHRTQATVTALSVPSCECLGASVGFHRSSCKLSVIPAQRAIAARSQ